jgi:secreted Zn-dependent insulinase-like peptidase
VKDQNHLSIKWVIPDRQELYYCNVSIVQLNVLFSSLCVEKYLDFIQPELYLSHLIGHEGDGSILSYLKKLGLATALMAGGINSTSGFNFSTVDIELTIDGLSK